MIELDDDEIQRLNKSSGLLYRPRTLENVTDTVIVSWSTTTRLKMVILLQHDCNAKRFQMICTFHSTKHTCKGDSGASVMRIPNSLNGRLVIFGIVSISGLGVDPVTNRLTQCQPNYTLGFHAPVYRNLEWIKKHTKSNLCLKYKKFLLDSDELFDYALLIIALATCTIILLSLISDQRAKFLRLDFSFAGNEGKKGKHKKQPEQANETGEAVKKGILPIKVKVSLSIDKITNK